MPPEGEFKTIREAVGVFDNPEAFQEAIDKLMSSGFDRAELSLLASEQTVDEKLSHHYEKVKELEDNPKIPRAAYVSTESIGARRADSSADSCMSGRPQRPVRS